MITQVYWIEEIETGRIGTMPRPRGSDWLEDEMYGQKRLGADVIVSALTEEENQELGLSQEDELCGKAGIDFISFPVPDIQVPPSREEFIRLVTDLARRLGQGQSIVIHCRQGIGRSTLVAVGVLIASGFSAAEALAKVEKARGRPVPDTEEQRDWIFAIEESISSPP